MNFRKIPLHLYLIYGAIALLAGVFVFQMFGSKAATERLYLTPQNQFTGPVDADVTIIEFLDYRCSFCREMHPVMQQVAAAHPDVRIIYRHLPVFGPQALHEAQFALAAGIQGRFTAAHNLLMNRETPLDDADMALEAQRLGIDAAQFTLDRRSAEIGVTLMDTVNAAEALGVNATPTYIINGRVIRPDDIGRLPTLEDFNEFIADARS